MADQNNQKRNNIANSSLKILLSWKAAERVWQPKSRAWYVVSALIILLSIFVVIRQGSGVIVYISVTALTVFAILWFIQGYIKPIEVEHKITNKGLFTHKKLFPWNEFRHFWFAQKKEQLLAHFDFPPEEARTRITILVPSELEFDVFNEIINYLKYASVEEAEYNFISTPIYGKHVPVSTYIEDIDTQAVSIPKQAEVQPTTAEQGKEDSA